MGSINLVRKESYLKNGQVILFDSETKEKIDLPNVYIANRPNFPIASKRVELGETNGTNGYHLIDYHCYKPITAEMTLTLKANTLQEQSLQNQRLSELMGKELLFKLYSDYGAYRRGVITEAKLENNYLMKFNQTATITLEVQPYLVYMFGQTTMQEGDFFSCEYGKITGTITFRGNGDITIGNMAFKHVPNDSDIIVDCQNKRTYSLYNSSAYVSRHYLKTSGEYYQFIPYQSLVLKGIDSINVDYEWRSI